MTKQEEIREGIKEAVDNSWVFNSADTAHPGYLSSEKATDQILSYLHSQGVVIKVDRELPELPDTSRANPGSVTWNNHIAAFNYQQDMLNAGYVAVEPLTKEVKGG